MIKAEVIREVAEEASITRWAAELAFNWIRDIIVNQVGTTGRFAMDGVGVFTLVERAARTGRNPQDGSPVKIEAKRVVKFKASKSFKEAVE